MVSACLLIVVYNSYNVYCMFVSSELLSLHQVLLLYIYLLVSEMANELPEVVYCCFTRTTLLTTMFTGNKFMWILCVHQFIAVLVSYMPVYTIMYGVKLLLLFSKNCNVYMLYNHF